MSDEEKHHEIVIIHRGHGGDHDDHHGGAWKIAFADFMTAMMALFLVMWLISSSNKAKTVLAHYFNPVHLVDSTTQPIGLHDPSPDKSGSKTSQPDKSIQTGGSVAPTKGTDRQPAPADTSEKGSPGGNEGNLFKDPYAVLSEIASGNGTGTGQTATGVGEKPGGKETPAVGLNGGEAFRDPFAPLTSSATDEADTADDTAPPPPPKPAQAVSAPPSPGARPAKPEPPAKVSQAATQEANRMRADINKAIGAEASAPPAPKVEVRATAEGTLVSLTDQSSFSMFPSASAIPDRKIVLMMAKIADVLKTKKGKVIIRGFTDGRPFKSATYDNWRLSTARAQIAYYMLLRGGLDEKRIARIEGYADRQPKTPQDPLNPQNRRIEILVQEDKP